MDDARRVVRARRAVVEQEVVAGVIADDRAVHRSRPARSPTSRRRRPCVPRPRAMFQSAFTLRIWLVTGQLLARLLVDRDEVADAVLVGRLAGRDRRPDDRAEHRPAAAQPPVRAFVPQPREVRQLALGGEQLDATGSMPSIPRTMTRAGLDPPQVARSNATRRHPTRIRRERIGPCRSVLRHGRGAEKRRPIAYSIDPSARQGVGSSWARRRRPDAADAGSPHRARARVSTPGFGAEPTHWLTGRGENLSSPPPRSPPRSPCRRRRRTESAGRRATTR